jgi:DNA-binding GntR family transcriptional regulator
MNSILNEAKPNLSQTAYIDIKEKIINGELPQGVVISISAVAEALNISRTPVTNACQRLEFEKFLTIVPKQGVIINSITIDDAREIYELRAAIETYSAKRAFDNISSNDIEYLKKSLDKQKQYISVGDIHSFMVEDTIFHKTLLKKYKNSQFFSVLDTLYDRAFLIGMRVSENYNRLKESYEEHERIITALENKDKNAFIEAIERNIISGYISLTGSYEY